MKLLRTLRHLAVLTLATASLAACKNDGQNPVMVDDRAATVSSPGNGAGNSATGATGGTATSPGASNAATVPGTTGAATGTGNYGGTGATGSSGSSGSTATPSPGTDMSGKPQVNTPPSR